MPDSNFNVTRSELISSALAIVGNSNPSTNENIDAVKRLNALIKKIDHQGRWLWALSQTESTLTQVVGQSAYNTGETATTIADDILELEWVARLESADFRDPLRIVSASEAQSTHLKDDDGQSEIVFLERKPLMSAQVMHFYPVPTTADTIVYTYRRRLYDFDNANDNPDLPQEWIEPLEYMLAYRLSHIYGTPLQERQLLKLEAQQALKEVRAANEAKFEYARQWSEYF